MNDAIDNLAATNHRKVAFIPRNGQFWLSHLALIGFISLVEISVILYRNWYVLSHVFRHFIWLATFTATALLFRKMYIERGWQNLTTANMVPRAIIFGTAGGALSSVVMGLLLYDYSTREFIAQQLSSNPYITRTSVILNLLITDILHIGSYIIAWIFIYNSTMTHRRAKQSELYNLRLQNTLKEAQLSSLSNQLNPHFLFNALNNIRFMIHENRQTADLMITSLSDILRYALISREQQKVVLTEELSIVERQIALAKIHLEERLSVNIDVDQQLEQQLIPPMLLQMLIENAIKHGIDNIQSGGALWLKISAHENQQIAIEVTNDTPPIKCVMPGMGIGLENIRQRLHLLYGDKASVIINPKNIPLQFHIIIILPKESLLENSRR